MTVYLLGAGPGAPGLLTLRGAQVLATAEVVIYDRLSQGAVLDMAPAAAELINVGKLPGKPRLPQEEINQLLIARGKTKHSVVRLKGGDPLVFARGGEEAKALLEAGVDFEIIPGISSAFAAPAYAGIPVTLRHSSTSVTVITGHEAENASAGPAEALPAVADAAHSKSVNWEAAVQLGGTLVILMGVARWPAIAERLLQAGMASATPAAAISWGTRPNQHTIRSTVGDLEHQPLQAPAVIVVGDVAAEDLAWFEKLPLFGRKVVATRPAAQSAGLAGMLRAQGAETFEVPLIEIAPPSDGGAELSAALDRLKTGAYSWVVFTSANGVRKFLEITRDARDFASAKIAAIGPATAEALANCNLKADLVPKQFVAESLLKEFPEPPAASPTVPKVLIARAEKARDVLPEGLTAKDWHTDVVSAYRTVGVSLSEADKQTFASSDVITFLSPSVVEQFAVECPEMVQTLAETSPSNPVPKPEIACVGPITAAAARNLGLPVAVEASVHTSEGLVMVLCEHFKRD